MQEPRRTRRWPALLLPALLGPLQLFLFGPYTLYRSNASEFSAPFLDLAIFWLPATLLIVAALVVVGLIMPDRFFQPYIGGLVGVGVVLWLQGNLLVLDYGLLDGQAMDWSVGAGQSPYEWLAWVGIPAGGVVVGVFAPTLSPFVAQLLVGLQAALLVVSAVQPGGVERAEWQGPPEWLYALSSDRNVLHFVLDGFQSDAFRQIVDEQRAEIDERYAGFVFYADHVGAFPTTFLSIPAMLTGGTYRNDRPIQAFTNRQFERGSIFSALREQGYEVDVVTGLASLGQYGTHGYRIPRPYATYDDYTRFAAWQLIDLSLFRHVPHAVKPAIYNDQAWRLQGWLGAGVTSDTTTGRFLPVNGLAVLEDFIASARIARSGLLYKFVHVGIPHWPVVLDAACEFVGLGGANRERYTDQARCAVATVGRLFDRLRALGVYDDALIVLSSDHGAALPPIGFSGNREMPTGELAVIAGGAQALLAVKVPGASGPLEVSDAPTTIGDIPATILDALDLPYGSLPGLPASRVAEDRPRSYAAYAWRNEDWRQRFFQYLDVFSLNGRPADGAAWAFDRTVYPPGATPGDRTRGLFGEERDPRGDLFRWGGAYVALQAPVGARELTLEVRSIAPETQTVRVVVNGEPRDEIVLADHEWHTLDYALTASADPELGPRVELWADPPFQPGGGDGRRLGVQTRGLTWTP